MPKPTIQNRSYFKRVLRTYKEKFDSVLQTCNYSDISPMFTTASSSITGDPQVNVVLFDGGEYDPSVDISSLVSDGNLIYFPAVMGDWITIKINGTLHRLHFPYDDGPLQLENGTQLNMDAMFFLTSKNTNGLGYSTYPATVRGYGGTLIELGNGQSVEITSPTTAVSVNEGASVTFTLQTTGVPVGTQLTYNFTGTVEFDHDFTTNPNNSVFQVQNDGSASMTVTLREDYSQLEGSENFKLNLTDPSNANIILGSSALVTVNDTSSATFSIAAVPANQVEGTTLTYTVNTTGVPDGHTLYYSFSSVSTTDNYDFSNNTHAGWFAINNNTGTFGVDVAQDFEIDDGETLIVQIRQNSASGSVVATSSTTIIDDLPFTFTITPSHTTVIESTQANVSSFTLDIQTSGAADGTIVYLYPRAQGGNSTFRISDIHDPQDAFDGGRNYYEATIQNNSITKSFTVARDGYTEGDEVFYIEAMTNNGVSIAVSPDITITDASYVGSRKTDKTFGPIRVNRDDGVAGNTSDWYTLCNLDQIPNNSKVALFIDTSGSMTMSTVQASYDELVAKLNQRGITFITVSNMQEDWITDFDVTL